MSPVYSAVFFTLALAWPALAPAAAGSGLRFEQGIARHPKSAVELYREQHWIRREAGRPVDRLVLYRCPDGTAFARKRVDYRASALSPAFSFEDRRSGYREGLRAGARPTLFYQAPGESGERRASVDAASLVADAGFDEFIRRQWAPLVAGGSLPFQFAVPSRLRSMAFSVQRAGAARVAGEAAWVFRLTLDGWLGLVAPAIEVSYGQASRRLLRFEGLSNLRDDTGRRQLSARIEFADAAVVADEAAWRAAADAPLSSCRTGH